MRLTISAVDVVVPAVTFITLRLVLSGLRNSEQNEVASNLISEGLRTKSELVCGTYMVDTHGFSMLLATAAYS